MQGGTGLATGNANVTYDAAHQVWLIQTIVITDGNGQIVVLRSADGANWGPNPILVSPPDQTSPDKPWINCDNTARSPFYGHCYIQWDTGGVGTLSFSTSTDGGLTWGAVEPRRIFSRRQWPGSGPTKRDSSCSSWDNGAAKLSDWPI